MQMKSTTTKLDSKSNGAAQFRIVALTELQSSPSNTRQHYDSDAIKSLSESIKQHGILQPILVREIKPTDAKAPKYQVIAGERRFRAAKRAGLTNIPAHIKTMSEAEALSAQIVENLQREDVHPLDEADGLRRLKEEMKLEISEIAKRLSKDARHIARRLALTNLIEEARKDFRAGLITLAHALEICRLAPDIQPEALIVCYERKSIWNQKEQTYTYLADKEKPIRPVRYLQEWLEQNIHLNLHKAPFKMDDVRLRADGLTCVECPHRTGHDQRLFADIKNGDTCLNPPCFQAKIQAFVQIRKTELDAKSDKPAAYISSYYDSRSNEKNALSKGAYQILEKKSDRCENAERAIVADGTEIGQVRWICGEQNCKDHLGRKSDYRSESGYSASNANQSEDRRKRKQELFDIKVDECVRLRVMKEALKTYTWPLERTHLNEIAKEFFRRIPSDDQRTICEVFGWEEKESTRFRYDYGSVLQVLAKLDDDELARFFMLCSFAHFGANPQKQRQADQKLVKALSSERRINHTLIDANARAELCPKKYKAAHQAYLDAVTKGEPAKKPVVYEKPYPQPATSDAGKASDAKNPKTKTGKKNNTTEAKAA